MDAGGDRGGDKRRGARSDRVGRAKKSKRAHSDTGPLGISGDDNDFVSPPRVIHSRTQQQPPQEDAPDYELTVEEDAMYPRAKMRAQSVILVNALKDLSFQQKSDIRELGFGALLEFNVEDIPSRLLRWLLYNFDAQSKSFDLGGGRSLVVDEGDVELILGFPRGRVDMFQRDRLKISNTLKQWRGLFQKQGHKITAAEISARMVEEVDGGLWFKRHFLMLVLTSLVCCMCSGYSNQMYFHHFEDVSSVRDLNWCKLVVDTLVETQAAWRSGRHKFFLGPAEFITLFYVDRVVHVARAVPQSIPALRGWSSPLLRHREFSEIKGGGFGLGVIELPVQVSDGAGEGDNAPQSSVDAPEPDCSSPVEYGPMTFADVVSHKTTMIAREISELVKQGPDGAFDGEVLRGVFEAIKSLRVVCAVQRADQQEAGFGDVSSFSLGITQDYPDHWWGDIEDVGRDLTPANTCRPGFDVEGDDTHVSGGDGLGAVVDGAVSDGVVCE